MLSPLMRVYMQKIFYINNTIIITLIQCIYIIRYMELFHLDLLKWGDDSMWFRAVLSRMYTFINVVSAWHTMYI